MINQKYLKQIVYFWTMCVYEGHEDRVLSKAENLDRAL